MARKDVPDCLVCLAFFFWGQRGEVSDAISSPLEYLTYWTDQPMKVCYAAIARALDRGLIEYGTSLHTGWLSDKGKALLG